MVHYGKSIRGKKYPVIAACRRGLICLSLICALIIQPYTVLANDSSAQVDSADASAENNTADPADAAAQNKAADTSEVSRDLKEDRKEEVNDDGMQADSVTSVGGEDNRDSAPEADGIEIKADANANVNSDANANANTDPNANAYANTGVNTGANTSASDDRATVDCEVKQDSVTEADGSEDNAVSDVNTNADEEVPGDGMTGDDRIHFIAEPGQTNQRGRKR